MLSASKFQRKNIELAENDIILFSKILSKNLKIKTVACKLHLITLDRKNYMSISNYKARLKKYRSLDYIELELEQFHIGIYISVFFSFTVSRNLKLCNNYVTFDT